MTLRSRLLLAQAPLAVALIAVAALSVVSSNMLGQAGTRILADNYRSVLAAQRMKESIERLDSAALFLVIGERDRGLALIREHRPAFERELQVQEQNITEPGEGEATRVLRDDWTRYQTGYDRFLASPPEQLQQKYLEVLQPGFLKVKASADDILALNQDAMVLKSNRLRQRSEWLQKPVVSRTLDPPVLRPLAPDALT